MERLLQDPLASNEGKDTHSSRQWAISLPYVRRTKLLTTQFFSLSNVTSVAREMPIHGMDCRLSGHRVSYHGDVYAQKFRVELVIHGERRVCPLEWLDQFCMRNFTNAAEFDDTLPIGEGAVEVSFRVTPERFAERFGAWLMQRGKGEGDSVRVEISKLT
jgi:hypothetical protein